jgi:hypothetical protein
MASDDQLKKPLFYGTFSGFLLSVRCHGFLTYFKILTGIEVFFRQDIIYLKKRQEHMLKSLDNI